MNTQQIIEALTDLFQQPLNDGEQRKIVFWVDKDQEFNEDIKNLFIEGVKVHTLTDQNQFHTKFLLEEEDQISSYLIYTQIDIDVEDNWLTDTVLYADKFYADRVSLLLNELHIDPSLRSVIKNYEKFFNNKDRFKKFQAYGVDSFTEERIELAIMGVLTQVKTPDFETILKTVFMDSLTESKNKYLSLMDKFFNIDVFWRYISKQYGYDQEEKSLKKLFIHLTVTALSHVVDETQLANIKDYISERNRPNIVVFIDHWMHHKTDYVVFQEYAEMVEQEIQLSNIMKHMSIESFKQADIFPYIDRAIIIHIANSLVNHLEDYEEYKKLIKLRRVKQYYETYQYIYEALYYTVQMHDFYKSHQHSISQGQAIDVYQSYVKDYYQMDTFYRKFYIAFDQESNHELLKKLKVLVENLYTNWFMGELSSHWSRSINSEMKKNWVMPGIRNQQHFYSNFIAPKIRKGERMFIIVSDAMRYEVGLELNERLNSETVGVCDVEPLLGVIPSITKLGMASLLPHQNLDFDEKGRVLVDGKDSSGLENRKKIIENEVEDSIAIHFQDVMAMNKAGRRETFKGKKLIYIYHDTIDAMGDKATTEMYTFNAVETALNQLYDLVKVIRDDLSATNVYITADHGFLYQRDSLEESDKIQIETMNAVEVKRRYMLAKDKKERAGLLDIDLTSVIKNKHQLTAYVPNSTVRYKMQGSGVNFVHGGASLQEVVVPLLSFKNKRTGQKGTQTIKKVEIKLTNTTRKITNSIFNLEFFQTEKVEEKVIPRTVVIYMADEEGTILSNEETIIGDRSFDNPKERTFKIQFVLKSISYDKNKNYYLIIKDAETNVAIEKISFSINLGIVSDFDF
ncbi:MULTISPECIES: BREX-1 system phosphatase PglZ type A [unclassified Priestia]|uniref:BREX-1 system phosphatase PglZ type A n=1 Tax=unclassified Priestia TaxID=2800374 RepID=UPI00366EE5CB